MCKDWPILLNTLYEKFEIPVTGGDSILGYPVFFVDLSQYKLRLSDHTAFIWARSTDIETMTSHHLAQSLLDVARAGRFIDDTAVILLDADSRSLNESLKMMSHRFVLIGADEQQGITNSRRPTSELLDIICNQVSILMLSPYEPNAYVSGSQFFGRELEVRRITSNPQKNYLITGIRRIGKTSLMKEIKRMLEKKEGHEVPYIIYMDCSDYSSNGLFIEDIVRKLHLQELERLRYRNFSFFFPSFLERMKKKYGHKIIFFLDEIDVLAEMQTKTENIFQIMRSASNKDACQFFLAGYRQAIRESDRADSPLYNFGEKIVLGEFSRNDAYKLIVTPMDGLRVTLKNREQLVSRIFHETAGLPNLIQVYCQLLLESLDQSNCRELSEKNLISVYENSRLRDTIRSSFLQNTEPMERLLMYALLKHLDQDLTRSFTPQAIDIALKKQGVRVSQPCIEDACQKLAMIGFFLRKANEITFTSPIFAKILIDLNLDYSLMKAKEECSNDL